MNRRNVLIGGGAVVVAGAGAAALGYRQMSSMEEYNAAVAASRAALSEKPSLRELVRFAVLAPNGHNTQPWRFRVAASRIDILPDPLRRTPVVDPDDHHVFVSIGAAAENLALGAAARGQQGEVVFDNTGAGAAGVVVGRGPVRSSPLFEAIPRRQSTRADYDGRQLSTAELNQLVAAATVPGVDMVLITDPAKMRQITDLVVTGNTAQMTDAAFLTELKRWLRFNPHAALATRDGLFSAASGSPVLPSWLGPTMFDRFAGVAHENEKYVRQLRSSAGIAVFVGARADPEHWFQVGRACQRFALQATALGLKQAFVNQPVEVASLRPELASLVGMPGRRPDIVMRFGRGLPLPFSARRPVEDVLV